MSWPKVAFLVIDVAGILLVVATYARYKVRHPEKPKALRAQLLAPLPVLLISLLNLVGHGHIVLGVVITVAAVVVMVVVGRDAGLFRMEW